MPLPRRKGSQVDAWYCQLIQCVTSIGAVIMPFAKRSVAFEILADEATYPDAAVRLKLVSALARASGVAASKTAM